MRRKVKAGGGWQAIFYTVNKAVQVGPIKLWRRMRSKNACKTCALGMGGMKGGMVNEAGHFPEVCKKSLQAQVADMQGGLAGDYFDKRPLAELLKLTPKQAEDQGRLTYPVVHREGDSHFRPISWEDALKHIAAELKAASPDRTAFYSSGRSSNEAGFLLQSFARVYGTNNVMNCSFYCHQASGVALKSVFGTGTATISLEDISKCDLMFLIGANPASNHPRLMTQLADLKERGGKVIVVNPIKEVGLTVFRVPSRPGSMLFGTKIADIYAQPKAGGDIPFLVGVLKWLLDYEKVDLDFLKKNTEGYAEVLKQASTTEWSELVEKSGVDRATIDATARMISESKAAIFAWAMGLTHHACGVDNVMAVANLALATGNVGKPGAGMLPIRGHSNVQGIGSVGVAPELQPKVKEVLERIYQKPLPETQGYDTYNMIDAAGRGELDVLFALGGNLWGSNPDSQWSSQSMRKIKTTVYLSTKLNPGHFHGRGQTTIILPVLARDEEPEPSTQESMFNFVRLSEGGEPNTPGTMRSEAQVICQLANLVLGDKPVDWLKLTKAREVRKLIAEAIPGLQEIATMDDTKQEFTITGRVFHQPTFNTPSGKAIMQVTPIPEFDEQALRLITLRSEGQFNSVVYEEYDLYRGIPHRHCILVSKEDLERLAIKDGQRVKVRGQAGEMTNIEVIKGDIKAGTVAMFYPEANVLIQGNLDKRSKTPSFKSAPVWIEKA
ncbi:MAG: FdhF/YdeP family oxidoreductase [Cyanobacteria bacterium SZAS TMP-1]|nr:FdhF/YdeP family oxidoreductase [Cyanobacteria bacterium SZAS TMP-1]